MADDRERYEREKPSWAEIDKRRDRGRSTRSEHPSGEQARQLAGQQKHNAVRAAEALFAGEGGGAEDATLAKAVRDAHGTPELAQACRDYVATLGVPTRLDLLSVFLDARDRECVLSALEKLGELAAAGGLEVSAGLRSQLRVLSQEPDDDIAGLAEDLLE